MDWKKKGGRIAIKWELYIKGAWDIRIKGYKNEAFKCD